MRCLVTGSSGFLGRNVVASLEREGFDVVGTDVTETTEGIQCDLRDQSAVGRLLAEARPSHVVHCGAISGPMLARDNPRLIFDVNAGGTLNLLEGLRDHRLDRFVLASSICAYGSRPDRSPVDERNPLEATDAYGSSKICAEAMLRSYSERQGFSGISLRLSSIYGPGRDTPCLIRSLVSSARNASPTVLNEKGEIMRQFVHIDDAVNAIRLATVAETKGQPAYNIAGGTFESEFEVARHVQAQLSDVSFVPTEAPGEHPDGDMGPLNITAAQRDLGYVPNVGFAAGVADYVAHLGR